MPSNHRRRTLCGCLALLIIGILLIGALQAPAQSANRALILDSSVHQGALSGEAQAAIALGFTVDVVGDAAWEAMTAAQFAQYRLVVVGDADCGVLPESVSRNAGPLADAVMARAGGNAAAGNRILIGSDVTLHSSLGTGGTGGGATLIAAGLDFAGARPGTTGLYLDFACADPDYDWNGVRDGQDRLLPRLTLDQTPGWTQYDWLSGANSPPCGGSVSLVSRAAQLSPLSSAILQGWGCSAHETFPTYPADWAPLALATDTTTRPTCGTDVDGGTTRCGQAYILVAGAGIVAQAPNLRLSPPTATRTTGTYGTVTATVTNSNGTPADDVAVSFIVTGANAGASGVCAPASCRSNASGDVSFTYTGSASGNDTIYAAATVAGSGQTATAAITWVAGTNEFACRASAGRLTGQPEPIVANAPDSPCRDESLSSPSSHLLSAGGQTARVLSRRTGTDQQPDALGSGDAQVGDRSTAYTQTTRASIGGVQVATTTTATDATAECTTGTTAPTLSSTSTVVGLRLGGQHLGDVSTEMTIPVSSGTLRVNSVTVSSTSIVRRALWLDNDVLPDVIIGEARAGYVGNPCAR